MEFVFLVLSVLCYLGLLQGVSWGPCLGVVGMFFVVYSLVCGSGIPFVGCDCMNVDVMDSCMHLK